jgi:hypothetical protein
MGKYKVLKSFLVLIQVSSFVILCSCGDYNQITIKNELGAYSFEYSSKYSKEVADDLEFDIPFTHLILDGPVKNETTEIIDPESGEIKTVTGRRGTSSIEVGISNYKVHYGESYDAAFRISKELEGAKKWDNFKLINRYSVLVSGIEGEIIEYLIDKLMPIPVEDGNNLWYCLEVFFDYNGLVWSIKARGNQEIREELKADFDHIVETFKILD